MCVCVCVCVCNVHLFFHILRGFVFISFWIRASYLSF